MQSPDDIRTISTSIIDPLHLTPDPHYLPRIDSFDGWFGIPFKDTIYFTNVCSPHLSEILTLYSLSTLIPLYLCTLFVAQLRTLVLHTFSFRVSHYIVNNFLSDIIPPAIPPLTYIQCISNCFTLQLLPAKYTWHTMYL